MKFTLFYENETSKERVKEFVDRTKDENPLHNEENRILPGMYVLHLLTPYISKPITKLDIIFEKFSLFPATLETQIEYLEDRTNFEIVNERDRAKYSCTIFHQNSSRISNSKKLDAIFKIPGAVQRKVQGTDLFPKGTIGIYNRQSISFNGHNSHEMGELTFENIQKNGKRGLNINLSYNSEGKIIAEGTTFATVIDERVIYRAIKESQKKVKLINLILNKTE